MFRSFQRHLTRRRVENLIREGVGIQEWAWPFDADVDDHFALTEAIGGWVREAMGRMRRPNGIDHVALALACRDRDGRVVCSNATGVVTPATFYAPDGEAAISGFLADASSIPAADRFEVVGALVSLGDLAYALGGTRAA